MNEIIILYIQRNIILKFNGIKNRIIEIKNLEYYKENYKD